MRLKKIKVMFDNPGRKAWTKDSKYFEFTENEGKVKLYSINPWDVEKEIRDIKKYAFIVEPYCLDLAKEQIDYVYENYEKFDAIFTHDDRLLQLPNARLYYWGGIWGSDTTKQKTKNLSIISSDKKGCPLHKDRIEMARYIKENNLGDAFGTFDGGNLVDTITAHASYKFAIVIENYIEDYWFTEKICNCFANKTVPIYIGARKIGKLFDNRGIIQVNNIDEIKELLDDFDFEKEYDARLEPIENNYVLCFEYTNALDWLFYNYAPDFLWGSSIS